VEGVWWWGSAGTIIYTLVNVGCMGGFFLGVRVGMGGFVCRYCGFRVVDGFYRVHEV
jgi:hypothetical protein